MPVFGGGVRRPASETVPRPAFGEVGDAAGVGGRRAGGAAVRSGARVLVGVVARGGTAVALLAAATLEVEPAQEVGVVVGRDRP
jgi:hypothetical protein